MPPLAPYIFGFVWLLGLPVGKPSNEVVSVIEQRLSSQKCIVPLARWHRHYQFQKRGSKINRSIVSIHYVEAGHDGLAVGRFITEPELSGIDDTQHQLVVGEYEISTGRITEWACGWNFPPRSEANGR